MEDNGEECIMAKTSISSTLFPFKLTLSHEPF